VRRDYTLDLSCIAAQTPFIEGGVHICAPTLAESLTTLMQMGDMAVLDTVNDKQRGVNQSLERLTVGAGVTAVGVFLPGRPRPPPAASRPPAPSPRVYSGGRPIEIAGYVTHPIGAMGAGNSNLRHAVDDVEREFAEHRSSTTSSRAARVCRRGPT